MICRDFCVILVLTNILSRIVKLMPYYLLRAVGHFLFCPSKLMSVGFVAVFYFSFSLYILTCLFFLLMHDLYLLIYFTCHFIYGIYQKSTHINAFLLLLEQWLCVCFYLLILILIHVIFVFVLLLHLCTGSQM